MHKPSDYNRVFFNFGMIDTRNNSLRDPSCVLFGSTLGLYPLLAHNTTPSSHDNQKCLRHGQVDPGEQNHLQPWSTGPQGGPVLSLSSSFRLVIPWVHTPPPWFENLSYCNWKDTITTPLYLLSISLVSRNLSFQNYKQNNISLQHISRQYSCYPSLFQMSYASGGRAQMGLEGLRAWD